MSDGKRAECLQRGEVVVAAAAAMSSKALGVLFSFSSCICGRPDTPIQPQVLRSGTWMEWAKAKLGAKSNLCSC